MYITTTPRDPRERTEYYEDADHLMFFTIDGVAMLKFTVIGRDYNEDKELTLNDFHQVSISEGR